MSLTQRLSELKYKHLVFPRAVIIIIFISVNVVFIKYNNVEQVIFSQFKLETTGISEKGVFRGDSSLRSSTSACRIAGGW